ncbi:hypothetical protein, partial [Helicobacter typhlonius]|uniref:hypothetical protein n=1 Tax=Helicobacter typhlonius TaxID=76936 RepID=UPI002FE1D0A9
MKHHKNPLGIILVIVFMGYIVILAFMSFGKLNNLILLLWFMANDVWGIEIIFCVFYNKAS